MELIEQDMKQDLVRMEESLDSLLNKEDTFNQITIRSLENKGLATFDEEKINQIAEFMPEINRAMSSFGRSNTQTTNKAMTLTMLNGAGSPYRLLRQTMTEIDSKRSALKENTFKLKEMKIKLYQLENKYQEETDTFKKQLLKLKIEKKMSGLQDTMLYIEGALKDIASFQDSYDQIRKANNIPENWDEKDMEDAEPAFHTRRCFEMIYRDIMVHGRVGMGTIEYLAQFGIHVQTADLLTRKYIQEVEEMIQNGKFPTQENLETHLDNMTDLFKDSYKESLSRLGINNPITEFSQFLDKSREEDRLLLENKSE